MNTTSINKAASDALHQTKDAVVYEALRGRILSNHYRPGERLREEELCREFAVTRTPLRSALRRLEHEHLVVGEPFKGVHVCEVQQDEIGPLFEMREVLEGLAARNVAAAANPAVLKKLLALARATDEAEAAEKWSVFLARDKAFHRELVHHSGNNKLLEVMEVYDFHLRTFAFHDQLLIYVVERLRAAAAQLMDQHQVLASSLGSGQPEAAEAAFRAHVRSSRAMVSSAWQQWKADQK